MAAAGVAKFKWPERLEVVAELPVTKVGKLDKGGQAGQEGAARHARLREELT
jgi:non-ribosomal peptide synthetase component E (peptide arylation enzyme)